MVGHATEVTLDIESVGARGDGIAHRDGKRIYVPFTAPGDRVRARAAPARDEQTAELLEVLRPGARALPVCRHFGVCGGCALQHLAAEAYVETKEAQVTAALAQHGVVAEERASLQRLPPGNRRRARFAVHRARDAKNAALVGFHGRATHRVVDMRACAVLHPAIFALVEPLRRVASALWPAGASGAATVTQCDAGLDVLLDLDETPEMAVAESMARFAEAQDLARLAWRSPDTTEPVPVAIRRPPRVILSGIAVDLPFDAFLQASLEAEAALIADVVAGIGSAQEVADLYAGLGTFSLALAESAAVHAVEASPAAARALAAATSRTGLTGRVTVEKRDLDARPLRVDELRPFDAVIFDPPRAGAHKQCLALAASSVTRIVAVSCNPATFARDARTLIDGGYRLRRVRPIDQFVWSPHVELVAWFER